MQDSSDIALPESIDAGEFRYVSALLDDDDPVVRSQVAARLQSYGSELTPVLRELMIRMPEPPATETLKAVIRHFQGNALRRLARELCTAPGAESTGTLENLFLLLSQFGYPETDREACTEYLDNLALDVHRHFIGSRVRNELNLVLTMNRVLFEEQHFGGAEDAHYYEPDNSYIHAMLQKRVGIPIALSAMYMLLAERVGVEIHGISLPGHFVVYSPELNVYIDTFNKGVFRSQNDYSQYLAGIDAARSDEVFAKADTRSIVLRMLKNLMYAHAKQGDSWEAGILQQTVQQVEETFNER